LAVAAAAGNKRNINNRSKRTPFENYFDFPNSCSLTENELEKITNLITKFYDEKDNQSTCEAKPTEVFVINSVGSSNRCNQLIESIIRNAKDVKIAINCLLKKSAESYDIRYEKLRATYKQEISKLQQKLDNAEKRFENNFKKKINDLNERVQELEKTLWGILKELENERSKVRILNLKLIQEYLETGKIHLASETFKSHLMGLDRNNIITITTNATNISMRNVIEFTSGLKDDVDAMVSGVINLFHELEKRKSLDRNTARLLQEKVDDIIQYCRDLDGTDLQETKLKLDRNVTDGLILVYNNLHFIKNNPSFYL
jgi:exonuclease VII large subunit